MYAARSLIAVVVFGVALAACLPVTPVPVPPGQFPPLPSTWPKSFGLGTSDGAGGAAALARVAPFGFRYQYLAGGVNTGNGWATWNANGDFATLLHRRLAGGGHRPGLHLLPDGAVESRLVPERVRRRRHQPQQRVDDGGVLQRSEAVLPEGRRGRRTTVLHVEPDLWSFLQQKATNDDATTVPAKVGSSGQADVAGLPDNVAGFAKAIVRLRDRYAPNVIVGYHFASWGTGTDILYSDPSDATVNSLGVRTARFEQSLGARFDIAFTDLSDRDAAFKQFVYGDGGASWYTADDYRRSTVFIGAFVHNAGAAGRVVAGPVRQHEDASREQHVGPLPGQQGRVAARRHHPGAPEGVCASGGGRGPVRPRCRRSHLCL